jgi:hypothetical protein
MEANTEILIGLALFVASEIIGMSRLKSNSLLQLLLGAAVRAFPYERKAKPPGPLDSLLGRKDRR